MVAVSKVLWISDAEAAIYPIPEDHFTWCVMNDLLNVFHQGSVITRNARHAGVRPAVGKLEENPDITARHAKA